MRTSESGQVVAGLFVAAMLLWACGEEPPPAPPELDLEDPDAFVIDGHVEFLAVEGGCWSILADDGTRYEPVGMPEQFHEHGLRVRAAVKRRPDLLSVCMVGTIVEVVEIERYPGG